MIDTTYLPRPDDHQATIARYLMHHPEDEYHPLMTLVEEVLGSLDALPSIMADDHEYERKDQMKAARVGKYEGWEPGRIQAAVREARWHNQAAVALRRIAR